MKKMYKLFLALFLVLVMAMPAIALNTTTDIAIAAPWGSFSGLPLGNPADGGWGFGFGGNGIEVTSYAQGNKSADSLSFATGVGFGKGGAFGIQTPNFGFGVSGAFSTLTFIGGGSGLGVDRFTFSQNLANNPDYASVKIIYDGQVGQGNGILVTNGSGTYAGGRNETHAHFYGGSFNESFGKIGPLENLIILPIPALAIGVDGANGWAAGFTIAGYVDTPNFASSNALTFGASGYCADAGEVWGSGHATHQAIVNNGGNFGQSYGQATFEYAGSGSLGYGIAKTGGWTAINAGPGFSSVTSFSSSHASSAVK